MPVSKKRIKKSQKRKPAAPPPSKAEISSKKKPLNRQQIAIYVISALVVLSMAVGFVVSGWGRSPSTTTQSGADNANIQELLATPAPSDTSGDAGSSEQNTDTASGEGSTSN